MDITAFQRANEERKLHWHAGNDWNFAEWTNAMAGETGEACNIAKKILRLENELPNKEAGLDRNDMEELKARLAREVADSIIYGLLIMSKLGVNGSDVIADVFDKKSEEYGFPNRAPR